MFDCVDFFNVGGIMIVQMASARLRRKAEEKQKKLKAVTL